MESKTKSIILNVGGTKFETTEQTLGMSAFFRVILKNHKDEIFIDRDPELFRHVLGIMRDPEYPFPYEFIYELKYYGVGYVVEEPHSAPVNCKDERKTPLLSTNCELFAGESVNHYSGALIVLAGKGLQDSDKTKKSWWIRKLNKKGRRDAATSISTIPHSIKEKGTSIYIPRSGDMISRVWIQFTTKPSFEKWHEVRYGLIKEFTWSFGGITVQLWSDLIEFLEEIQKPANVRQFCQDHDKTGVVCIGLPFWFSNVFGNNDDYSTCGFSMTGMRLVNLNITLDPEMSIFYGLDNFCLITEQVFLDCPDRDKLRAKTVDTFSYWKRLDRDVERDQRFIDFKLIGNHPCDTFVFGCRSSDETFIPIRQFRVVLNGYIFIDVSGRMLVEQMACLGYFPEKPIYQYRISHGSINLERYDKIMIHFELPVEHVDGRLSFFFKMHNLV